MSVCQARECHGDGIAAIKIAATCGQGHNRDRVLCQGCFDWIWPRTGYKPQCTMCDDGERAKLLEAIQVKSQL